MKHIELECNCDNPHCNICNLFTCKVCGCSEGQLPTDCPGVPLLYETKEDIYNGVLDYKEGVWVHTPKGESSNGTH